MPNKVAQHQFGAPSSERWNLGIRQSTGGKNGSALSDLNRHGSGEKCPGGRATNRTEEKGDQLSARKEQPAEQGWK